MCRGVSGRGRTRRHAGWVALVLLAGALWGAVATAQDTFEIIGETIELGEKRRLLLETGKGFSGMQVSVPVVVARGLETGPVLCLTAGVHGDELIGVEAVRRIAEDLEPLELRGAVVAVPIANPHGFRRSSRYLPDRRDLNRYFPGSRLGSAASRIAATIFDGVIRRCEYLVDFHTGSFHRTNTPHLRGDLRNPLVRELARYFGAPVVIHSTGGAGMLRRAAMDIGITALTFEAGEPMRFEEEGIEVGVEGVSRLMVALGMMDGALDLSKTPEFYYRTRWVRVDDGGILLTSAKLGEKVAVGDVLGTVTDPITNQRQVLTSPYAGRIVGMALSQVVIPGFAAFHVAIEGATLVDAESDGEVDIDLEEAMSPESDRDPRPEE